MHALLNEKFILCDLSRNSYIYFVFEKRKSELNYVVIDFNVPQDTDKYRPE